MSDVSTAEANLRNARAGLAHLLSIGNAREAEVMLDLVKRFEAEHKAAVEQVAEMEKQAIARAQGMLRCECEEIARFKGLRECVLHPKAQGADERLERAFEAANRRQLAELQSFLRQRPSASQQAHPKPRPGATYEEGVAEGQARAEEQLAVILDPHNRRRFGFKGLLAMVEELSRQASAAYEASLLK